MTNSLLYTAETWDKVYSAFQQVNFTSYDHDAIKQSLLDYIKLNYPENFNDYIESSQLVALIEAFAYMGEQHAYRMDMLAHENLLPTARRKQSVLRIANALAYSATRNLPLRGLVKFDAVSCSEDIYDSQGNNLANKQVKWADANNPTWREQFMLIMGKLLVSQVGMPMKSVQVDDLLLQQYEIRNLLESSADGTSFSNGVLKLSTQINGQDVKFELTPADIDDAGAFERAPAPTQHFSVLYSDDGYGDASPTTGFMMFIKQGSLQKLTYTFDSALPNRTVDITLPNINDTDVWLYQLNEAGGIEAVWEQVDVVDNENIAFNTTASKKRYEVQTLEDDQVRLVFGSGDFAEIPLGTFQIWVRTSTSGNMVLPKADLKGASTTFAYTSKQGRRESCTIVYSLTANLQNATPSEDVEHIRKVAPSNFATQGRMVNGEDYNSFLLKSPSVLKLKAANRTFAGQPKYIDWNDASTSYQNVKIFGDDGRLYFDIAADAVTTTTSTRRLVDEAIEPLLNTPQVYNMIAYAYRTAGVPMSLAYVRPRTKFIESFTLGVQEKTAIQGALDRHWYGEPSATVYLGSDLTTTTTPLHPYGLVNDDTDLRVYDPSQQLVTYSSATGLYTLVPWPNAVSGMQTGAARHKKFGIRFNPDRAFTSSVFIKPAASTETTLVDAFTTADVSIIGYTDTFTIELINQAGTFTVHSKKHGYLENATLGEAYTNGYISFKLLNAGGFLVAGDAFIINIVNGIPTIYKKNLLGKFEIIGETSLPANAETTAYDVMTPANSWLFLVERIDRADGSIDSWRLTTRSFGLTFESPTTKLWYNTDAPVIDPDTKLRVYDQIKILKSNLDASRTTSIGKDHQYVTTGSVLYADGTLNTHALRLAPTTVTNQATAADGRPYLAVQFLDFIASNDYVYFVQNSTTGKLTFAPATSYLRSLTYVNDVAGSYVRRKGRENLDFAWMHYATNEALIDPSPSNIIDMYVLTSGYYSGLVDYLQGVTTIEPTLPTPYELRNTYSSLLKAKMMSDTVVLHPAKVKLLFGSKAAPQLRARLKLLKTASSRLTDDQLRSKALATVQAAFDINYVEFGTTFYATALAAAVHKAMPLDIASAVLVPEFPANYYGDLMQVVANPDELLLSAMELKDIEVITSLDATTLRQKL